MRIVKVCTLFSCLLGAIAHGAEREIQWNGFFTLGVSYLESDNTDSYQVLDRASLVPKETDFDSYTRLGLNLNAQINEDIRFAGQLVARGVNLDSTVAADWMFLTYQPSDLFYLKLGKTLLNTWKYSEYPDVGVAYPYAALPEEVYSFFPVKSLFGAVIGGEYFLTDDISFDYEFGYGSIRQEVQVPPSANSTFAGEDVSIAKISIGRPEFRLRAAVASGEFHIATFDSPIIARGGLSSVGFSSDWDSFFIEGEAVELRTDSFVVETTYTYTDLSLAQNAFAAAATDMGIAQGTAIGAATAAAADPTNTALQTAAADAAQAYLEALQHYEFVQNRYIAVATELGAQSTSADGMKAYYGTIGGRLGGSWSVYATTAKIEIPDNGSFLGNQESRTLGVNYSLDFNSMVKFELKQIEIEDRGLFNSYGSADPEDKDATKYTLTYNILF